MASSFNSCCWSVPLLNLLIALAYLSSGGHLVYYAIVHYAFHDGGRILRVTLMIFAYNYVACIGRFRRGC